MKRAIASLTALLIGAGVALVGVGAPASADGGTTTIDWDESHNHASYWEDYGPHENGSCYKDSHGSLSEDGKSVTLPAFDPNWPGDHWELLVVKAGQLENVTIHPDAGVAYAAPDGKDVSHWIVCKGTTPEPEPVFDAAASVTITPATCTTPGSAQVAGLAFASLVGALDLTPGVHSATFQATGDHKFPGNLAQLVVEYTIPDRDLSLCPTIEFCTTEGTLPTATNLDPQGWVIKADRGEFVEGGLHLWSTDTTSGWAQKPLGIPFSQVGDLSTVYSDKSTIYTFGVILTLDGPQPDHTFGKQQIHYDEDGRYWTDQEGILGNGAILKGGYWETYDLEADLVNDVTINNIVLYVNAGQGGLVIHSQNHSCGTQPFDFEEPVIVVTPAQPVWIDPCGDDNGYWSYEDGEGYSFNGLPNGELVLTAEEGYAFPEGQTTWWQETDSGEACPNVIIEDEPLAPTFEDPCGFAGDTVNLPEDTELYSYELEWSEDGNTATVTVIAAEGYAFGEDVVTSWEHTFTDEACPVVVTHNNPPPTGGGLADTGTEVGMGVLIAALLVAAGGAFLLNHRRRAQQ